MGPLQKSVKNLENLRVDPHKMHWNYMRTEECEGNGNHVQKSYGGPYKNMLKVLFSNSYAIPWWVLSSTFCIVYTCMFICFPLCFSKLLEPPKESCISWATKSLKNTSLNKTKRNYKFVRGSAFLTTSKNNSNLFSFRIFLKMKLALKNHFFVIKIRTAQPLERNRTLSSNRNWP